VGYHTVVTHLLVGLQLISESEANELAAKDPQDIRRQILNSASSNQVHMVDINWIGRAIDCEITDFLVVPADVTCESPHLQKHSRSLVQAIQPGIDRLTIDDKEWSAFVRVSPQKYVGRSCFRFDEACE
jgi:hypothetical protein